MSVVRFTESDVIVASGPYVLDNTRDAQGWNMSLQYPNGNYILNNIKSGDRVDYAGQFGSADQLKFYYAQSSFITLQTLIDDDSAETPQSTIGVDGSYNWNGQFFEKQ